MSPNVQDATMTANVDDAVGGSSFERVLVPVEPFAASVNALSLATRFAHGARAELRLMHLRIWEPAVPARGGRFTAETSEEATAILESAMDLVWARGVAATGIVVEAERALAADVIVTEATAWGADLIVLTARPRPSRVTGAWDRLTRKVVQSAACPVLLVYPGRS